MMMRFALVLCVISATGCDRLLRVSEPDVVQSTAPTVLTLPTLTASTIGTFAAAYGGSENEPGIISWGGLLADELHSADGSPYTIETDARRATANDNINNPVDQNLQVARATAQQTASAYRQLKPGVALEAEAYSFTGFAYLLAAETYCSGMPFSTIQSNGTIIFGSPEPTLAIVSNARARFDTALAILASDNVPADAPELATERSLAAIGKGRALLDSGAFAAAAAAVAAVPDGFVYALAYSTNSGEQTNGVFYWSDLEEGYSVSDLEGGNGVPYRSANDPRVLFADLGVGPDGSTEVFGQLKYATLSAAIPLATGIEARLIEAEAALQAGDAATFQAKLNAARAQFPGVAPLATVPASRDSAVTLLFQERALDLWLTAHRLGDMRRLVRQYARGAATVFPTGSYYKGGEYGAAVSMIIPSQETANPNYKSCDPATP